jgi:hypothetical protein
MNPKQDNAIAKEEFQAANQKILQRLDETETKQEMSIVKLEVNHIKNDLSDTKEDVDGLNKYSSNSIKDIARSNSAYDRLLSILTEIEQTMLKREHFNEAMNRILARQNKLIAMVETMLKEMQARRSTFC